MEQLIEVMMANPTPFGKKSTADEVLAGLDLTGKTFLITGCNSGIGFETMSALAARGGHIIGLARTFKSAKLACDSVGGNANPVECDLTSPDSIRRGLEIIASLSRPVDAIITNAGMMGTKVLQALHGVEAQFFVNHIAHFILVNRLLRLVPSQSGRIVVVSSSASIDQAPKEGIMFDNLDGSRYYKPFEFYGQSKLANALFAKELSRRIEKRGIAVNSLHPGAVGGTALQRNLGFPLSLVLAIARNFMKTIPQGAATQALLAASPTVEGITGQYWSDCQIARGSSYLDDDQMAARLWEVSETIASGICSD
jgi:WW domain-containing oxidoreductase